MTDESTTPDAVALTHGVADAASRRDFDAVARFWTPDGVWDMTPMGMGVFEGHEAIRAFMADWIGAYEDFEVKAEEIRDLGNGVIFALLAQRGRPFDSNGFVHLRYASVTTWRNGLIQRSAQYTDIDQARVAAERLAEERG
jgi:ketosteroid isomerase-like protein